MPIMELMATVDSPDSETHVRGRVVRFLTSRGYQATADPAEFKRGSLFGSLTGFTPRRWRVTVRFKPVEPGVFFYRFEIDTTGQTVTRGEREFWNDEKNALEAVITGRVPQSMSISERKVSTQNMEIVKTIAVYSLAGGMLVGVATIALHFAGVEIVPGIAGVGAGIGAAVGLQRAVYTT